MIIRPPQAAGKLYPSDADDLISTLAELLLSFPATKKDPSALVVPHESVELAGFPMAAAFRHLSNSALNINQVVIIGAATEKANGVVLPVCDQFRTPLGSVPVNQFQLNSLALLPFVHINEREHFVSNTIEIQLPYLQTCLIDFEILPILVGNIDALDLQTLFESLPNNSETLTILSLDINRKTRTCANATEQFLFDNFVEYVEDKSRHMFDADNSELPQPLNLLAAKSNFRSFVVN